MLFASGKDLASDMSQQTSSLNPTFQSANIQNSSEIKPESSSLISVNSQPISPFCVAPPTSILPSNVFIPQVPSFTAIASASTFVMPSFNVPPPLIQQQQQQINLLPNVSDFSVPPPSWLNSDQSIRQVHKSSSQFQTSREIPSDPRLRKRLNEATLLQATMDSNSISQNINAKNLKTDIAETEQKNVTCDSSEFISNNSLPSTLNSNFIPKSNCTSQGKKTNAPQVQTFIEQSNFIYQINENNILIVQPNIDKYNILEKTKTNIPHIQSITGQANFICQENNRNISHFQPSVYPSTNVETQSTQDNMSYLQPIFKQSSIIQENKTCVPHPIIYDSRQWDILPTQSCPANISNNPYSPSVAIKSEFSQDSQPRTKKRHDTKISNEKKVDRSNRHQEKNSVKHDSVKIKHKHSISYSKSTNSDSKRQPKYRSHNKDTSYRSRSSERRNYRDPDKEKKHSHSSERSRSRSFERRKSRNEQKNILKYSPKSFRNKSTSHYKRSHKRSRSRSRERSRSRSTHKSFEKDRHLKGRCCENVNSLSRNSRRDSSLSSNHHRKKCKSERVDVPEDQPSLSTEAAKYILSSSAESYYSKVSENSKEIIGTDKLLALHEKFRFELVDRATRAKAIKPKYEPPARKTKLRKPKLTEASNSTNSSSSNNESSSDEEDTAIEELEKKRKHPDRLHPELWFNDPKEMNDGPLCRCSAKARRSGIRHGIYVGEEPLPPCNPLSNNIGRLYHYKITMTPHTNFMTKSPTKIMHNGKKYIFEGFSMFSHFVLPKLPNCKVIRFNYEYTILYIEEPMPQNFSIAGLELFNKFLLEEILELVDLNWKAHNDPDGCPRFHFMPRFAKELENGGKEFLSLNVVMAYLLKSNEILIDEKNLSETLEYSDRKWQELADEVKGMIVTCPGMKPSSVRVDQLDREDYGNNKVDFPIIVHFGVRPPQLSYAGNPLYQKAWRDYVKYRHLLANKPKVRYEDRRKLTQKEMKLQSMRMENDLKRDVTVVVSSKGFYRTGIMSDVIQHAMLMPVLVCHLRFHHSLNHLEEKIGYKFQDRFLLQLALTHPSYRENFGTNPDHARNSLTNCGLRQPQYGDRRIHYMNTRKRGINTLINIMSRFGSQKEATSCINHNERLEFLGDAVVEFLSSIHLFYMFPQLEEGGLATYRAAIVQNQHLAVLSKKLQLEKYMLYAHGSDLCHDLELRHAMANCFEALMGALFLDNGIEVADRVFSETLFPEPELQVVWKDYPLHPLQEQEPDGDRKWIPSVPLLQKIHEFEEKIGIEFTHIRLLARALTHRSLGFNNLTLGSNQRLEFLGDTVLQLVASEYLYKYFPQHHEGHLSLLRSSLVNNRTQAVVCADLGMVEYAIYPYSKLELKPKDKADLLEGELKSGDIRHELISEDIPVRHTPNIKTKDKADFMEAFLGALYVDKDLGFCKKFCEVCFFPRLQDFIMNQDWNDPKSKLQQCCLTLRSMDGGEPDIPMYKVIECKGPTNTRVYSVAVYFQGRRLAVGTGHSIQQAEMDAASNALRKSKDLFPQLKHQKRAIERSLKHGPPKKRNVHKRLFTHME